MKTAPAKTKHSPDCRMAFGRKDPSCARCQELLAGAPARAGWGDLRKHHEAQRIKAIREHDFAACMRRSVVCTCFDY
jgi:hypothetical protein